MSIFLISVIAILAGLLMAAFAGKAGNPLLSTIVWWVGVALIVVGLILLLTPVIVWLNLQLRAMLAT